MRGHETMTDFDSWTKTGKARNWLHENNATLLLDRWGFLFYENPLTGDESPVLAVRSGGSPASAVWNTQDFDLPTSNPLEAW